MLLRLLTATLCLAHGSLHLGFITPPPDDPAYPFRIDESWLVPAAAQRQVGLTLATIAILAFAGLAVVVLGIRRIRYAWRPLLGIGGTASLLLLIGYWNPWLIIGVGINTALLAVTFAVPDWWDRVFA